MPQSSYRLYLRLLGYLRPYLSRFVLALLAMVLVAAMEPLVPALLRPLVDEGFLRGESLGSSLPTQWIPALIVLVFSAKALFEYFGNVLSQWVSNSAIRDIRAELFDAQIAMPLGDPSAGDAGDFISRISYDASQVSAAITSAFLVLLKDTLIVIGLTAYLVFLSWKLTLVVLIVIPIVALFIYLAGQKLRTSNKALQLLMARMTAHLRSAYGGLRDIKLYRLEAKSGRDFRMLATEVVQETMRGVRVQAVNLPMVQVLAAIGVAIVIWFALNLQGEQAITPGLFVSYIAALAMIFEPIRRISAVNLTIQKGLAAAESIFTILDSPREKTVERPSLKSPCIPTKDTYLKVTNLDACWNLFDNQSGFKLSNVSFSLSLGQVLVIVGSSGAGKSTLLSAILGFAPVTAGDIFWGQEKLTKQPIELRNLFAVVSQHPYLFTGTIKDNLVSDTDTPESEIWEALTLVSMADDVHRLGGLDAVLADDASQLSGGQRQRLAIARALLRVSAPIIVFDEATNAIEENLEEQIFSGIRESLPSRALILVTHRLESISLADHVLVLKSGLVVAQGTPNQVKQRDSFRAMQVTP